MRSTRTRHTFSAAPSACRAEQADHDEHQRGRLGHANASIAAEILDWDVEHIRIARAVAAVAFRRNKIGYFHANPQHEIVGASDHVIAEVVAARKTTCGPMATTMALSTRRTTTCGLYGSQIIPDVIQGIEFIDGIREDKVAA